MLQPIGFLFPCVEGCDRGSHSERGLSVHQATCPYVKKHTTNTQKRLAKKFEARTSLRKRQLQSRVVSNHDIVNILPLSTDSIQSQTRVELPSEPSAVSPNVEGTDFIDTQFGDDPLPADPPPFVESHPPSDTDETPRGRGLRKKRPTWKILEQRQTLVQADHPATNQPEAIVPESRPFSLTSFSTRPDQFGLYRKYHYLPNSQDETRPNHIPSSTTTEIHPASHVPPMLVTASGQDPTHDTSSLDLSGCTNRSTRMFMEWFWRSSQKSLDDANYLAHHVLLNDDFLLSEMVGFDARRETANIDAAARKRKDRWHESSVDIYVPDGKPHLKPEDGPIPIFSVSGLHHRSITEIIKDVWSQPESLSFEYIPYRLFWQKDPASIPEQVHGELYTSEAFNRAYEDLLRGPGEPDCKLERVICALMLYSDSTHLANFGDAALWPIYLFFGNQSKYTRACPTSGSCHHLAYIPKVHVFLTVGYYFTERDIFPSYFADAR